MYVCVYIYMYVYVHNLNNFALHLKLKHIINQLYFNDHKIYIEKKESQDFCSMTGI